MYYVKEYPSIVSCYHNHDTAFGDQIPCIHHPRLKCRQYTFNKGLKSIANIRNSSKIGTYLRTRKFRELSIIDINLDLEVCQWSLSWRRMENMKYCKRRIFRVGLVFAFFAHLSSSRKLRDVKIKPICLYEGNRSSIVKITPTWNVLPAFSRHDPLAKITTFTVLCPEMPKRANYN